MLRIGLVEDNPGDARLIQEMLREPPVTQFRLTLSTRVDELLESLDRDPIEVLLLDLGLPDSQGMDTFHRINDRAPGLPIVIFSGADDEQLASEAVSCGAQDYLVKGRINSFLLKRAIRYAMERKRTEEEIRTLNRDLEHRVAERTAQLVAANKELEAFSYSVSHDLRAPLRHIEGYVGMLRRATEGILPENGERYLKTISSATVEMGQLIDDLLAFSRMSAEEMHEAPVDLGTVIEEVLRGLQLATRDRRIEWKIESLPLVIGDFAMLRQVFANLIDNAIKYTRGRELAEIDIGVAGVEGGRRIFFVRDNGAGFDMRYAHKLFGVFHRLHNVEEFEGTGIGLATTRRIIERHGGRTWAEGVVDQGATFYFTLRPAPAP
ncbi:MAG TPA: ATP-binding protein [Gemmatimonadaceae bacterium]|nr:ATP-binding protein [Gemmatimonadaceae bacterium]